MQILLFGNTAKK